MGVNRMKKWPRSSLPSSWRPNQNPDRDNDRSQGQDSQDQQRKPNEQAGLEKALCLHTIKSPARPKLPGLVNQAVEEGEAELGGEVEDKESDKNGRYASQRRKQEKARSCKQGGNVEGVFVGSGPVGEGERKLTSTPSVIAATAESLKYVADAKGRKRRR